MPTSRLLPRKNLRLRNNIHTRKYSDNGTSTSNPPSALRIDPSSSHHNLQTFLQYAAQTSLSATSTTYLGTRYEYLTQLHLSTHLQFNLTRTGGRGDSGIDLLGTWPLPSIQRAHHPATPYPDSSTSDTPASDAIHVIIQCKRLSRVAGPSLMRELEGSFRGAPSGWRGPNVLGVMVCSRAATKGIRDAMVRSQRGLVWIYLEEAENLEDQTAHLDGHEDISNVKSQVSNQENIPQRATSHPHKKDHTSLEASNQKFPSGIPRTHMRQFLYNAAAASECGLQGIDVGLKYDSRSTSTGTRQRVGGEPEIQLLWQGRPLDFGRG